LYFKNVKWWRSGQVALDDGHDLAAGESTERTTRGIDLGEVGNAIAFVVSADPRKRLLLGLGLAAGAGGELGLKNAPHVPDSGDDERHGLAGVVAVEDWGGVVASEAQAELGLALGLLLDELAHNQAQHLVGLTKELQLAIDAPVRCVEVV